MFATCGFDSCEKFKCYCLFKINNGNIYVSQMGFNLYDTNIKY